MTDDYLSRDRAHLAKMQRKRRERMRRLDYMPGAEAEAIIEAKRATERAGSVAATNSAVLDAIVCEWARLTGINKGDLESPMSPAKQAGVNRRLCAGAYESGRSPELLLASQARADAYENGADQPSWGAGWLAESKAKQSRVVCGAQRHRDGQPCQALSEPGKRRCRFHGGKSTGPRTARGKARALANLRQFTGGKLFGAGVDKRGQVADSSLPVDSSVRSAELDPQALSGADQS